MAAFTQIPSLVSFAPLTTILSADVNNNLASIRNQFNNLVTGTNAIAVDTISENTLNAGVTVNKKFIASAGVSITGGTLNVTAIGVNGVATFTSGFAISGGSLLATGIAANLGTVTIPGTGAPTFASGFAVTAGVPTFSSGITVTAGTVAVQAITATNALVTTAGASAAAAIGLGNDATTGFYQTVAGAVSIVSSGVKIFDSKNGQGIFAFTNLIMSVTNDVVCQPAALVTSATVGFIYIPTMTATASGTPSGHTGTVALAYETTGNHLMVFNGGAWKQVALA